MVFAWLTPYVSHWIPQLDEYRIALAIAGDGLLVLELFLLGGDFWDKLRALFIHDAKAQFPTSVPNGAPPEISPGANSIP